ncbi:type III ribulose-bisphosphate carboxylase [Candidatus Pacearchaeota archaeon CG10_big_fil_rev_8_21_14_0_10_35_219]|nr:type III ribulose-bisphosphate carboxylase [Candidatus Pacearchaeota archaeon]OIO43146.1 MAG: ribulose-bisphosphate carboxylase large subunit [Candidatus Pacearchaeota archaeon CG1_02_35_32]PIO08076.1 MAG: type III ribulose-bisphosphate carboxylase [Candidatus Pacearchaeota archaeon CG10_big_fil_rev_8_21_14_0_10_35_219]PIY81589.1 MAG: type III ribulose-bisphosphate carboxylase [Candidatus Pacearchaeota archaeon CG_4_10_14_0_8_um_filter_35_169]PIZ78964.1 MAG: type III ribulose-bisphosphate ca
MSQYLDFVDMKYKPKKDDLICLFRIEPNGLSFNDAIGRVAAESSNGTWTTLSTLKPHIRKIRGRAFYRKGNLVKIAYPSELFELGNMAQVYSAIAGNIFGMKAVDNLRLLDIDFPDMMMKSFRGPQFGIEGVRKFMKVKGRPLTATVPKPKVGMTTREHAKVGYDAWMGGIDFLKDDENLTDQKFNRFKARAKACAKMRDKAEKKTGEIKDYFINVTAESKEMLKRAKIAKNYGFKYVMCDIVTAGWSGLQTLREHCQDSKQAIHAHRAMHATFTRNPKHGISMLTLAKSARLVGVDNIHIGTVIGKLVGTKDEVLNLEREMEYHSMREDFKEGILEEDWKRIKSVFPCSSGGLHPGILPEIMDMMGKNIMVQLGGGIHGHPDGTKSGAMATRQAIDAYIRKVKIKEATLIYPELTRALNKWGHEKPV